MNTSESHVTHTHLDPDALGLYIEGGGTAQERRDAEAHLAACEECYWLFVETVRSLDAGASAVAEHAPAPDQSPSDESAWAALWGRSSGESPKPTGLARPRRFWLTSGALVAAATLSVIVWVQSQRPLGGQLPEAAQLVAAVGDRRPTEGRLTGGFAYGAVPSPMRSGSSTIRISADVEVAAIRVQQAVSGDTSAKALSASGVAHLVTGELDEGIEALGRAVKAAPDDARAHSDLAAPLLERARLFGRRDDLPLALHAAERAVQLDPKLPEARFNYALALERLSRTSEALREWDAYLRLDRQSEWATEARRHIADLRESGG